MYETSDSDDDSYDKFPQKLQKLKTKHALNNLLSIVDNTADTNEFDSNSLNVISKQDADVIPVPVITRSRKSKRKNTDIQLSPITSTQKGGKRARGRNRERGKANQTSVPTVPLQRNRLRRRGTGTQNGTQSNSITVDILTPSPLRSGRGRRRGNQQISRNAQSYITYSVGNTDEYPDASDNQVLFSNKQITTGEPSAIIDLDESLDNEELSVKVYWQHSEVFKFNIRKFQKLTQIFDFFVNKEGVSRDRLLFTYYYNKTNKILRPDHTPESINYNIAKFIEGGIVNKEFSLNLSNTPQKKEKKGFAIKFQCQNRKKPIELSIHKDEKLHLVMLKCAEHLEIPISKLVFEFDGETIQGTATPNDLEMDNGDCIDVKIVDK